MARKNIILCGFMGCGKSTIGNLLSRKAGMAFIDLDRYIEKQEGKTVSEIFADSGEAHFRMLERSASKTLGAKNGLVIACGSGAVRILEVQAPGGKPMRTEDFLRGHQMPARIENGEEA